jgi:hypothetical protein
MIEIAVAVDVHEPAAARDPRTVQAAEQNAAIAANDYGKAPAMQDFHDLPGHLQRERTDRHTVADARTGLSVELIRRPFERDRLLRVQRVCKPRIHQRLRCAPRSLLPVADGTQAEIARRQDDAHGTAACARGLRQQRCGRGHYEFPARHDHRPLSGVITVKDYCTGYGLRQRSDCCIEGTLREIRSCPA